MLIFVSIRRIYSLTLKAVVLLDFVLLFKYIFLNQVTFYRQILGLMNSDRSLESRNRIKESASLET